MVAMHISDKPFLFVKHLKADNNELNWEFSPEQENETLSAYSLSVGSWFHSVIFQMLISQTFIILEQFSNHLELSMFKSKPL